MGVKSEQTLIYAEFRWLGGAGCDLPLEKLPEKRNVAIRDYGQLCSCHLLGDRCQVEMVVCHWQIIHVQMNGATTPKKLLPRHRIYLQRHMLGAALVNIMSWVATEMTTRSVSLTLMTFSCYAKRPRAVVCTARLLAQTTT